MDGNGPEIDVLSAPDDAERPLEARGVAHREELLGVRASTVASHLDRVRRWTSRTPSLVTP